MLPLSAGGWVGGLLGTAVGFGACDSPDRVGSTVGVVVSSPGPSVGTVVGWSDGVLVGSSPGVGVADGVRVGLVGVARGVGVLVEGVSLVCTTGSLEAVM
jgi:hypothetical protein